MIRVLDSADPLNAKADKQAGYQAHGRYLLGAYALTAKEVQDATDHGVGIVSLCEKGPQAALGGTTQGHLDAHAYVTQAERMRQPSGSVLIATVDFDPTPAQLGSVLRYLEAFSADVRACGFISGAYGGTTVMQEVADHVDIRMQAAGWSNGITVPGCHLYQQLAQVVVGGVSCDLDLVGPGVSYYGAWNLHGLVPSPTTSSTEDEMILTHLHDGQAVVVFPAESGYRPLGPEMQAWLLSAGYQFKPPLPQNPPLKNLGPFSA